MANLYLSDVLTALGPVNLKTKDSRPERVEQAVSDRNVSFLGRMHAAPSTKLRSNPWSVSTVFHKSATSNNTELESFPNGDRGAIRGSQRVEHVPAHQQTGQCVLSMRLACPGHFQTCGQYPASKYRIAAHWDDSMSKEAQNPH